jgi:hypothetical protein
MKKLGAIFFVVFFVSFVFTLGLARSQEKNLWANTAVTTKIRAYDQEFISSCDVYMVWVKDAPMALLFDIKDDDYHIAGRFWGQPLRQEEVIRAINNINDQYNNTLIWYIPFRPQALNVVNLKGKVLGYVYTGLDSVLMDRKKDGSVTVYPPDPLNGGGGGSGAFGFGFH